MVPRVIWLFDRLSTKFFMSTTSGETVPESTLQGILATTLVTTMLFDQAVQLHTSTVVDSAVLGSHIVV